MQNVTVKDIVAATRGVLLCGDEDTVLTDICINSKEIKPGDLFIPIIGAKVDAHKFIESAMEIGAATLTSQHNDVVISEKAYIRVEDTQKALQDIGDYIRKRVALPVVGVTGSVGKTTTREMITAVLQTKYKTFHTMGNFNSEIGLPLTLSRLTDEDEIAVLEMGTSNFGEIELLTSIARPNACVVTNIGISHIEFFKTRENIRTEKLSIIDGMDNDGVLFLNGDDLMLAEMKDKMPCKTFFYGCNDWCDYRALNIEVKDGKTHFIYKHGDLEEEIVLNVLGKHNVLNALAALAVAEYYSIPAQQAKEGFVEFQGQRQRMLHLENKYNIFDDTYNASPASVKASVDVLCDLDCEGKRFVVLGDMFELGDDTVKYHYELGEYIATKHIDELLVVGNLSKNIRQAVMDTNPNIPTYEFADNEEVAIYLMAVMKPEDIVLIKGSNGMHLKEIVNILIA